MNVRTRWQEMKSTIVLMTQKITQRRKRGDTIHQRSTFIGGSQKKDINITASTGKRNVLAEVEVRAVSQRVAVIDSDAQLLFSQLEKAAAFMLDYSVGHPDLANSFRFFL